MAKKDSNAGSSSRSRTRERRLERQRQKRQQRQITILLGIGAMAVVGVILFILINQPAEAPIPEGTLDRYEGIPQGRTEDGFAILGNPDAPVRLEEFSSFSCPGCAEFHESYTDIIKEQVSAGVISFTFIPMTTGSIPNAAGAANSAICAGEQGAFFEYHDMLFDWHTRFGNQAFSQNRMSSGVENLGLNVGEYESCLGSSRPDDIMDAADQVANDRGVNATPTMFINGNAWAGTDLEQDILSALAATGLSPVPLNTDDEPESAATPEVEATEETTEPEAETTEEAAATEDAEATEEPDDTATEVEATEEADSEEDESVEPEAEATEEAN